MNETRLAGEELRPIAFSGGGQGVLARAVDLGFMARHGIRLELSSSQDSEKQARALLNREFDIATSDPDNWVFWIEDRGADFFFFMVTAGTRTGGNDFYVTPKIQSFDDLRGKTIAVDSAFSGQSTVVRLILRRNGLVIDRDYTFLPVGYSPQRARAIREGRAVGASLNEAAAEGEDGRAAGLRRFAVESDYIDVYPRGAYATTRRFAAEHPQLLLRFIGAVIDAQAWLQDPANEETAVAAIARAEGMSAERATQLHREMAARIGPLSAEEQVREDMIQLLLDLRAEVGLLARPTPPVSKYVAPEWYGLALRLREMGVDGPGR